MWNLNCKSVLSATTCAPFIHAGLPASSKHFKHRHDLSLLHSHPHFSTRTLHSAHCSHFKHGLDLSLILTSGLACSAPLTPSTLNNDMTSHCSRLQYSHAPQRSLLPH